MSLVAELVSRRAGARDASGPEGRNYQRREGDRAKKKKKQKPRSTFELLGPFVLVLFFLPLSFPLAFLILPFHSLSRNHFRTLSTMKKHHLKNVAKKTQRNTSLPPTNKWSAEEEQALRDGVDEYGAGKWRVIQKDPVFGAVLSTRSNVDLKVRGLKQREREREERATRKKKKKKEWRRKKNVFFFLP